MGTRLPLVSPLERALFLRSHPHLSGLSSDVIAVMAANTREAFLPKGTIFKEEDSPVDTLYFIVEGRIRVQHRDGLLFHLEPPGGAGLWWALAEFEGGPAFAADTDAVVLEIGVDPFFDILEDHFPLVLQLYDVLSGELTRLERDLGEPPRVSEPPQNPPPCPTQPLDLVERLLWTTRCGAFEDVNLSALSELVRAHPEIRLQPGEVLWNEGEPSEFLALVTHGVVRCSSPHTYRNFSAGPTVVIGIDDTIAGRSRSYSARAATGSILIRVDRQTYLDVLEDNFDLALRGLRYYASTILKTQQQLRSRKGRQPF